MRRIVFILFFLVSSRGIAQPFISSFAPSSGPIGTLVTINGNNFNPIRDSNIVYFGATKAVIQTATASTLTVIVPSGASYQPVTVTVNGLTAYSSMLFDVTFTSTDSLFRSITFSPPQQQSLVSNCIPLQVLIQDINGDGKPDIIFTQLNPLLVSVLVNSGGGKFGSKTGLQIRNTPQQVISVDLDGDGKMDLVVLCNNHDGNSATIAVYRNTTILNGPVSFAPIQEFSVGINTVRILAGDVDNDGRPDLVLGCADTISVFRNISSQGIISLAAKTDFKTGYSDQSNKIFLGDVDGDGKIELVTGNNIGQIYIYRSTTGCGFDFNSPSIFGSLNSPSYPYLCDVDGDGKNDIVVVSSVSNQLSILHNTTVSNVFSFDPAISYQTPNNSTIIKINDFDGDGKPDILIDGTSLTTGTLALFRNVSTPGIISLLNPFIFSTGQYLYNGGFDLGDLDADSKPEIIFSSGNTISILRNRISEPVISSIISKKSVTNGDTILIYGNRFSNVTSVLLGGSPASSFSIQSDSVIMAFVGIIQNPNGFIKLSSSYGSDSINSFRYKIPVISSISPSSGPIGSQVTINGNYFNPIRDSNFVYFGATKAVIKSATTNALTVIVPSGANYQSISVTSYGLTSYSSEPFNVTFNNADTVFRPTSFGNKIVKATPVSTKAVYIKDMDGDGKPDLIALDWSRQKISIFRGTNSAADFSGYSTSVDYATDVNPMDVMATDLDGDGKPDIAVVHNSANTARSIYVYQNTSTGPGNIACAAPIILQTVQYYNRIYFSDIDGDGKPDLVVGAWADTISIYLNTSTIGNISFSAKIDIKTGIFSDGILGLQDMDGDGKPDLVMGQNYGQVAFLKNLSGIGQINFGSQIPVSNYGGYNSVTTFDVDGDGRNDIVALGPSSNKLSVFLNTGSPAGLSFASPITFATGSNAFRIIVSDFDGDGRQDISVLNHNSSYNNDSISYYRNQSSSGQISFAPKAVYAFGDNMLDIAAGDLNGDSKPDLLVACSNTGISLIRNKIGEPIISSVTANKYVITGDTIVIKGINFSNVISVSIGGKPVNSFTILSDTLIKAVAGIGSSGNVLVKNANAADSISGLQFTGPPSINSFSPVSGAIGSLVTVTGNYLNSTTSIQIGGVSAILVSKNDSQVVAIVMPGAVSGAISLSNTIGTAVSSSNFNVKPTGYPNQQQGNKLVASDAYNSNGWILEGQSVAVSADGNTAVVGGNGDNGFTGAVWIFTRSGGVWTQQGNKLVGTGIGPGSAEQGNSVAISADGNTVIVGGYGDNNIQGAAWIFTRSGGIWTQQGNKIVGTGSGTGFSKQGFSVAISADGNTAIVGAPGDNNFYGAAWIFTRNGNTWSQQGNKLVVTGATGSPGLGYSVSLSADGNTAILGGIGDNGLTGACWIFRRTDTVWIQQGNKLVGSGAKGIAKQGWSVALSADGNTAIEGSYLDSSQVGAAWIFTRSGNQWIQQGNKLVGSDEAGNAQFGYSVSLSADGNVAMVGGPNDTLAAGAVWTFVRNGNAWKQMGPKLTSTDYNGFSYMGNFVSLSLDGSTAFAGGSLDNNDAGAAWAFIASPMITVTGNLTPFTSCMGGVSNTKSIKVGGNNLSNAITITAPAGFEVSPIPGNGFGSSISLSPTNGIVSDTTVYIRLAASATGTPSGNISFASTGATIQNLAVSGTLNSLPAIPTLSANRSTLLCLGDSVILSSSVATNNQWYKNQVAIPGATGISYTIAYSGVYSDSITNSYGCKSGSVLDTVVVNAHPPIPMISFSKPSPICFGDSIILSSSATTGNQWYKNSIAIPGATGMAYTVGYSGVYTDSITNSSGCKSVSSLDTVIVNSLPAKPIISMSKTGPICFGDSIILSSSSVIGNQWYVNNIAIPGATGVSYTVAYSGVYADTVLNSAGCKAGATLNALTVNSLPAVPMITANRPSHINLGDSVQLTSSIGLGNQWYKNQVLINAATTSNFSTNQNGTYTDTVTNSAGCKSGSAPVSVFVNTFPIISSVAPSNGNVGSSVVINGYNFSSTPSNNLVYFGSVKANVIASTSNTITAIVPIAAGYLPISVTVNNLTGYSNNAFNVTYAVSTPVIPNNFFIRQKADSALKTAPISDLYNWDLDGDGKPDIIATIFSTVNNTNPITGSLPGAILIARNTSNAAGVSFTDKQILTTGLKPSKIAFGDLDGDGKPDLITANQGDNTISVFRNISSPGNIAFDTRKDFAVGSNNSFPSGYPNAVTIGDLNNDGKPDIVASVGDASIFSIFKNTSTPGSISFATRQDMGQLLNGLNAPVDVLITDLDKDGKGDIVFSNISSDSGHVVIFRNTTTADSITVANKQDIKINSYVWKLSAGDLDGDGLTDILTGDNISNNIHILRNTSTIGNISFANVLNIPVGPTLTNGLTSPSANCVLNNFNGDNKPDIAILTNSKLDSSFLLINTSSPGNISFSPYVIKTGNPFANLLTSADFDGDGKQDIAGNDVFSISVLLNKLGMVPSISSFSPALASTNDTIIIKGNGLTTVASVSFGGAPALSFSALSDSLIKAVVGSGASGNVVITSPARVDSLPGFIYGLPEITVSDSTKTNLIFGSFLNINSPDQFFILTGKRLRDSVNLKATHSDTAAHPNFMMSLYPDSLFSTRLSFAPKNYTLDSTKIYIRFNTAVAGTFTDTIAISSTKSVSKTINLIGRACDSTISLIPFINSITADSNICVRDSVVLSSAIPYNYYKWSTGDTTASITVKAQGNISLQVAKQVGCYSKASPFAKIIKDNNPIPSLAITLDTILISTSAPNYRWLFNNSIIPGSISSQLIVNKIGFYRVETSNDKICWDPSSDYNLVILSNRLVNDTISIKAYPNPATGGTFNIVATLQRVTNVIASVTITDITGATLLQTSKFLFFGNQIKIPVTVSSKGTLFVKVNVNGDIKIITVIVQ